MMNLRKFTRKPTRDFTDLVDEFSSFLLLLKLKNLLSIDLGVNNISALTDSRGRDDAYERARP
jgi:hypothetical protein